MKNIRATSVRFALAAISILAFSFPGVSFGQTIFKSNTNTLANTGDFTTGDVGGSSVAGPNYTGDVGFFDSTISKANENALTLGANVTIDGLSFAASLNSYVNLTDATYTLNLGPSGIDMSLANFGVGLNSAIALTANQTWNVDAGNATYASSATNAATAYQSTTSGTGLLYVGGNISGNFGITKTGVGILNLGGTSNTFSGGVVVDSGILGIENNTAAGTGTVTLGATSGSANSTLEVTGQISTGPTAISVAAGNTGTATIFLYSGNNTMTSTIALANNLTLETGAGGSTLSGAITGTGNIDLISYSSSASGYINLTGSIGMTGTITDNDTNTHAASISGVLGASVTGVIDNSTSSLLTISGANTAYTAGFTVNAGATLATGSGTALGENDTITVASGGILDLANTQTGPNTYADAGTVNIYSATQGSSEVYTGSGVINIGKNAVTSTSTTGTSPNQTTTVTTSTTGLSQTFGSATAQTVLTGFTGTINVGAAATASQVATTPSGGATTTTYTYTQTQAKTEIAASTAVGSTINVADAATLYVVQPSGGTTLLAGAIDIGGTGNGEGYGALRLDSGIISGNILLTDNGTSFANTTPTGYTTVTTGETEGSAGGTGVVFGSNGAGTISGVISDGGLGFGIQSAAAGGGTITLAGANTFTGATNWTTTTKLDLDNALALQFSTLNDTGTGAITFDKLVTTNAFILGGLSGSSNLALQNTNNTAIAVSVGNDNASTSYSGVLSGTGSFVKIGTGTTTLTGNSTYSGGTSVNGGVLSVNNAFVNASSSGTGTGAVAVNNGGTLGGGSTAANGGTLVTLDTDHAALKTYAAKTTGIITGAVTINSGGILAPGNSVGTLTVGTLTLDSGAVANYEFNGSANDFTFVTTAGGLTLGTTANSVDFNLYQEGTTNAFDTVGVYDLIGYSGTLNGLLSSLVVENAQSGFTYTFSNDTTDDIIQVDIQASAAPEPSTWMLFGLGLGALVMVGRTRRSSQSGA